MSLVPRYPLFGGWSSTFTFGYSLPLSSAVGKVRCNPSRSLLQGRLLAGRIELLWVHSVKGRNVARQLTLGSTEPSPPCRTPLLPSLGCRSPRRAAPCLPPPWAPPWKTWWPTPWWSRCGCG